MTTTIAYDQVVLADAKSDEIFSRSLPDTSSFQESKLMRLWQEFDVKVLRKIFKICMPVDCIISLSKNSSLGPLPDGKFVLPGDVLCEVYGAMESCRLFRDQIGTYFWTEHHFFVPLSMFTSPKLNIQSQVWFKKYLPIVQELTICLDLTRFGGRQQITAALKDRNLECKKVEGIIGDYIDGILERCGPDGSHLQMAVFNLILQDYTPDRAKLWTSKTYETCASEDMMLYDKFKDLQGVVKTHQTDKFPVEYAVMTAGAIFGSTLDAEPFPKFSQEVPTAAADVATGCGSKLKRSPETMNRLNEQDPAYVRSVSAMVGLVLEEEGEGEEKKKEEEK